MDVFFCGWTTRSRFPNPFWHTGTNPSLHGNFTLHAVEWYWLIGRFNWIQLNDKQKIIPCLKPGTKKTWKEKHEVFRERNHHHARKTYCKSIPKLNNSLYLEQMFWFSCLVDKVKSWSLVWEVGLENHGFRWDLFLVPRKKTAVLSILLLLIRFKQGCTAQRLGQKGPKAQKTHHLSCLSQSKHLLAVSRFS